eukprot:4935731-Alexandrium_andersonii.AAC.1
MPAGAQHGVPRGLIPHALGIVYPYCGGNDRRGPAGFTIDPEVYDDGRRTRLRALKGETLEEPRSPE